MNLGSLTFIGQRIGHIGRIFKKIRWKKIILLEDVLYYQFEISAKYSSDGNHNEQWLLCSRFLNKVFHNNSGRTGSAWLTEFLSPNLAINAIHEPLGLDVFGVNMPDIWTMRSFNDFVKAFWERKFASLPNTIYAETNHTICKCGLVENIFLN